MVYLRIFVVLLVLTGILSVTLLTVCNLKPIY
jgi:hypothetical protein